MSAVSGISQAVAIREMPVQAAVSTSVAKKSLDTAEAAGQMIVEMLQDANQTVGTKIDVRV